MSVALNLKLIGTSDIPSLAGLSDLPGPVAVYNRIAHGIDSFRSDWLNEAGALGNACEWGIAEVAADKLGLDREDLAKFESIEEPGGLAGFRASLDPVVLPATMLEIKMRSYWSMQAQGWGPAGSGEIPPDVFAQVQSAMHLVWLDRDDARWRGTEIPDVDVCNVVLCVNGQELRIYRVGRDREVGAGLVELAQRWRERHIIRGMPPPLDGSEASRKALLRRHPKAGDAIRAATPKEAKLLARYFKARIAAEKHEAKRDLLEQQICRAIGPDLGIEADGHRVTWPQRKGRTQYKDVADALARRLELAPVELKQIFEFHRGQDYRVVAVKEDA